MVEIEHDRTIPMTELKLDCRWYKFNEAPPGSYACVHAPDGTLKSGKLSWMPAARGQIPAAAMRGLILPIPAIGMEDAKDHPHD